MRFAVIGVLLVIVRRAVGHGVAPRKTRLVVSDQGNVLPHFAKFHAYMRPRYHQSVLWNLRRLFFL